MWPFKKKPKITLNCQQHDKVRIKGDKLEVEYRFVHTNRETNKTSIRDVEGRTYEIRTKDFLKHFEYIPVKVSNDN